MAYQYTFPVTLTFFARGKDHCNQHIYGLCLKQAQNAGMSSMMDVS